MKLENVFFIKSVNFTLFYKPQISYGGLCQVTKTYKLFGTLILDDNTMITI